MNASDAIQILVHAVLADDGTFTLLRMGQDPGEERFSELQRALRILAPELADATVFPRQIAFACGVMLHFKEECISNLQHFEGDHVGHRKTVVNYVGDLCQDAFNVLSGEIVGNGKSHGHP
jgi:hypothetical protein